MQGSSWRNCHESEVEWKEDECAAPKTEDRGNGATSPESETAEPGQAAVARPLFGSEGERLKYRCPTNSVEIMLRTGSSLLLEFKRAQNKNTTKCLTERYTYTLFGALL